MENYQPLVEKQRNFFLEGNTKPLSFRKKSLLTLKEGIKKYEKELIQALKDDLNKSEFDAYATEIGVVLSEISYVFKHFEKWAKPRKVPTPLTHIGSKGYIYPEPYGVSFIISPWNYPFQLAVAPLVGAIAAGNCAIIKPSEMTPKTSAVLAHFIKDHFPEEYIAVVEGGVETSQALLKEKFDYIFFTGSVHVGKVVMEEASKHLTPVTLELGGKSPCIVHEDANMEVAAKRIAWGKFSNSGQTCIAPDYLYVHENIKEKFLTSLKQSIIDLYGENPLTNDNITKIVNNKHFQRLIKYLEDGTIYFGGKIDEINRKIEPTILTNITWEDEVMGDEIFGPILPVLTYTNLSDVIKEVKNHPKPLACYIFSERKTYQDEVLEGISFGGGCVNDTVYHFSHPHLPFGGVGNSGIGSYHGKSSFQTFSHEKSVLKQTTKFDIPLRYPNFPNGLKWIKKVLK